MQKIKDHPSYQLFNLTTCGDYKQDRMAFGEKTLLNEFPWHAMLIHKKNDRSEIIVCGGSLISDKYVRFMNSMNINITIITVFKGRYCRTLSSTTAK